MEQNNKEKEIEIETEKSKLLSAISFIADKLTKINISLDVLRTNINVSQFFLNDLYKNVGKKIGEKISKENKEKIIKTCEIYNSLDETKILNEINELSKKILLLQIEQGEKK